jgi:DNA polymerase-3 subunit alpha
MAALLTSVRDDKDKMAVYLAECRRMGIKVLPPDVNLSDSTFTPTGTDIRFGLSAVRNVGENVVSSVVATRRAKGAYADFADFLRKVDAVVCNKRTIESLIKAGAFDSLGHSRRGLMNVYEQSIDAVVDTKRAEAMGQDDLFGSLSDGSAAAVDIFAVPVPTGEWRKSDLLAFEREMLGLYVSDHPLFGVEHVLADAADVSIAELTSEGREEGWVTIAGIVSSVTRKITKAGAPWAQAVIEDLSGAIEVLFFPKTYEKHGMQLAEDAIVAVRGRVDTRDETVTLIAQELTLPEIGAVPPVGPVRISLQPHRCTPPLVDRLREVLAAHPGSTEVHLELAAGERRHRLRLPDGLRVTRTPALMGDLKALLGSSAVDG